MNEKIRELHELKEKYNNSEQKIKGLIKDIGFRRDKQEDRAERIKQLEKEVKEEKARPQGVLWKPEEEEVYYIKNSLGQTVLCTHASNLQLAFRYKHNILSPTEEECETLAVRHQAGLRVIREIAVFNGDWVKVKGLGSNEPYYYPELKAVELKGSYCPSLPKEFQIRPMSGEEGETLLSKITPDFKLWLGV